jgi:hypothetical protein
MVAAGTPAGDVRTLGDIVHASEVVIIGRVTDRGEELVGSAGVPIVPSRLEQVRVLKGAVAGDAFIAQYGTADGSVVTESGLLSVGATYVIFANRAPDLSDQDATVLWPTSVLAGVFVLSNDGSIAISVDADRTARHVPSFRLEALEAYVLEG